MYRDIIGHLSLEWYHFDTKLFILGSTDLRLCKLINPLEPKQLSIEYYVTNGLEQESANFFY